MEIRKSDHVGTGLRAGSIQKLISYGLIAAFSAAVLTAVGVCVVAASRGLDLTDEGIYLITYRWYQHPELTFTSSSAIFGPIFRLFGWNIAALRVVKLVLVLATSGFLGQATYRYFSRRIAVVSTFGRTGHIAYVLMVLFGGISLYSWLPQSPGYNDLAIFLATASLATALLWIDAEGKRGHALFALLGFEGMLLFFVKWPSAFGAGLVIVMLTALVAGRRLLRAIPVGIGGAVLALLIVQIVAGKLVTRVTALSSSSGTMLKGLSFKEAYLDLYLDDFRSVATNMARSGLVVLVVCAIVGAIVARRSQVAALVLVGVGLLATVGSAWRKQWFVGGAENVRGLENVFPILTLAAVVFVAFCAFGLRRSSAVAADGNGMISSAVADPDHLHHRDQVVTSSTGSRTPQQAKELWAGLVAVLALPLAQALGTGNPPLTIAACAGAASTAAIVVLLLIGVEMGGRAAALPAMVLVGALGLAPLSLGVRGLWQQPFRITGGMEAQTATTPSLPSMKGVKVDPVTADVLTKLASVISDNNLVGRPGITTFNGTGVAFALGLRHPPSGVFVEEALPDVLRLRLEEACDAGVLSPKTLPIVLTAGKFPTATKDALTSCGIDFPNSYSSEDVVATGELAKGTLPTTITVWLPKR